MPDRTRSGTLWTHDYDPESYHRSRYGSERTRARALRFRRIFQSMLPPGPAGAGEVLEVGAGTGYFTLQLLARGFRVRATDLNPKMLRALESRVRQAGFADRCTTEQKDILQLGYATGRFDGVVCLKLLPRTPWPGIQMDALGGLARTVRAGGWLLADVRNAFGPFNLLRAGRGLTPSEVRTALRRGGMVPTRVQPLHLAGQTRRWPRKVVRVLDRIETRLDLLPSFLASSHLLLAHKPRLGPPPEAHPRSVFSSSGR